MHSNSSKYNNNNVIVMLVMNPKGSLKTTLENVKSCLDSGPITNVENTLPGSYLLATFLAYFWGALFAKFGPKILTDII